MPEALAAGTAVLLSARRPADSYQTYMLVSARTIASACLLERVYTTTMTCATHNGDTTELPERQCSNDLSERFSFDVDDLDSRTFTLTVTATGGTGATIVKKCW